MNIIDKLSKEDLDRITELIESDDELDNKIGVFGPGVKKYGATGLGCNYHNELLKLAAYFQTNYPTISFQLNNKTTIGKCHSLRCYTQAAALNEVALFLQSVTK